MKYGFSKQSLCNSLKQINVDYVHIPELGIETEERKNLSHDSDYQKLLNFTTKKYCLFSKKLF
jgi:uncharacterized protein (DUF488 family)